MRSIFQVIRAVSQSCYGSTHGERLLIHISYSPRRCHLIFLLVNFGALFKTCLQFLNWDSTCLCCSTFLYQGAIFPLKFCFFSSILLYFCMELSANVSGHVICGIYILMCYRWACRICEVASGSLRPCDFKYSKLLASLQTFRCTFNFEIR